jgi:hypothetical protein
MVVNTRVMDLARQNKNAEAISLAQSEGSQFFEAAAKCAQDDVDLNDQGAADAAKNAAAAFSSSRYWVIGILIGAVALGFVVALSLARSITSSATKMLTMIQEVAANNLTVKDMEITSEDEIGQAGIALNGMKNSLHEMIQSILSSAMQVASASEELNEPADHSQLRGDFGAVHHLLLRQTDIGRIILRLIRDPWCHDGLRASRSKNTVRMRISSAVSAHATRGTRSPYSGIARNLRCTPGRRGS